MDAVILAAGMGTRLRPYTDNLPKCLIEIEGKTLLEYSLDALLVNGVKRVLIVTGFLAEMIKTRFGNNYQGIDINYINNDEYETTGHAYSLSLSNDFINDDTLIIEGDLFYEPLAVEFLIKNSDENVILTASLSGSGDEVFLYTDKYGNLTNIKRDKKNTFTINKDLTQDDILLGELTGLSKFSKKFFDNIYSSIQNAYKKGNKEQYYEEALFLASREMPVKCRLMKDLVWTEIDDEKDLLKARKIFKDMSHKFTDKVK